MIFRLYNLEICELKLVATHQNTTSGFLEFALLWAPIDQPMKKAIWLLLIACPVFGQQLAPLTVEKIMRDPKWIGVYPSNISWSEDGKQVYFNWNPEKNKG